jgi:CCR4-NOT transcription complex subunit 1
MGGGGGGGVAHRLNPSDADSGVGVTNVLNDLGPACTANAATLRDTLREVSSNGAPIDEAVVARLIFFFSERGSRNKGNGVPGGGGGGDISSALVGTLTNDDRDAGEASDWDLAVAARLLTEDYGRLDWGLVAQRLDFADFFVRDVGHLTALLALYQAGAKAPLPLPAIVAAAWQNQAGQLSIIDALLSVPSGVYSFALDTSEAADAAIVPPEGASATCPNPAGWASAKVLQRLLQLSDVPVLVQKVRDLFVRCLMSCPEVLLCAIVRIQISLTQRGAASAGGGPDPAIANVGHRLKGELMRELIPLFFKPPTSKHSVSHGPAAIRRLWVISPTTVAAACIEAWRSTSADPPPVRYASVIHIVSIMVRLIPDSEQAKETILNGNKDHEFSVAVAFVMADHDLLQIQPWLTDRSTMNAGGLLFLVGLMAYISKGYQAARPRMPGGNASNSPLISMENLAKSLQFLRGLPDAVLSQPIPNSLRASNSGSKFGDSAKALIDACLNTHQSLNSAVERVTIAGPATGTNGAPAPSSGSAEDIEEMANKYFQKIYTSEEGLTGVVEMLKKFKTSGNQRENDIFACMIHNLFDEYRFFPKYPEKELRITGILFGMLIQHQLVSSITLGIALRYVLEALRKEPKGGTTSPSGKMFRFGMFALEQFKERLHEWPQYCSHIVQIPHLKSGYADLVAEIEVAMADNQNRPSSAMGSVTGDGLANAADPSKGFGSQSDFSMGGITPPAAATPAPPVVQKKIEPAIFGVGLGRAVKNKEEAKHEAPSGAILDKVQFLINNVSMSNVEQKAQEVKKILDPKYFGWLGQYLVVKRISTQPNFHALYLAFLDHLGEFGRGLVEAILSCAYFNIGVCLRSDKITTSTMERSLLKNLGSWLGQTTLARNRPILQIMLDCKELLFQGYETGKLIAVTPFVAKILEGAKNSVVFRPRNPWTMGLMNVFRAVYEVEDLKMNIKFEIEVLCKNLGLKLEDIPLRPEILANRAPPTKERNPDFNIKASTATATPASVTPSMPSFGSAASFGEKQGALASAALAASEAPAPSGEQQGTVIPNLASYVTITANLAQLLQQASSSVTEATIKRAVPLAVDRAIREIIQPVVERSVTIACITTKEIVTKDFAMESDENKLRKGAQLMVANLAGSLALVTCREPLRGSITTHLLQLLSKEDGTEQEKSALEQCVNVCATDNLELGCMLIEKAATEKAVRDVDDVLKSALSTRKSHREQTGQPFFDVSIFNKGRYPAGLPDPLRPKPGGLRADQLLVYESFQRAPRTPNFLAQQQDGASGGSIDGIKEGGKVNIDALAAIAAKMDSSVTTLLLAAGARAVEITLAMLPSEHEIKRLIMAARKATMPAGTQSLPALTPAESDGILAFAQKVFKRLYELSLTEPLRLEAYVGLLEVLCDCVPKLKSNLGTWATYAPTESESQRKLHRTVLLLLMRSRLLIPEDLDRYLAKSMDGGKNALWIEFSVLFVRAAVLEKILSPVDLPKVVDTLKSIADGQGSQQVLQNYRKPILRLLEELQTTPGSSAYHDERNLGNGKNSYQESSSMSSTSLNNLASATRRAAEALEAVKAADPANAKQQVTFLLDNWVRLYSETPGNDRTLQYVQVLQQNGVGKSDEQTERFFRLSCEIVVDAVLTSASRGDVEQKNKSRTEGKQLNYSVVDAYAALLTSLVRLMYNAGPDEAVAAQRLGMLNKILGVTVRSMMADYERAKMSAGSNIPHWDQRPWFRLLLNLIIDINKPSVELDPIRLGILKVFGSALHVVQPLVMPGFAFAWLELVSHRMFLPNLLISKGQKGWDIAHQLMVDLFLFLEPHLRKTELTDAMKEYYKGSLRVLMVILHDFPSFLAGYHLSFCNIIPENCVQLRNLVLSAFPKGMVLPDPFTPNLKIDLLPETSQSPAVLSNVLGPLGTMRTDLDRYLAAPQQSDFLSKLGPRLYKEGSKTIDSARVNSLVLYVGMHAIQRLHNSQIAHGLAHTHEMEVLQKLMDLDDHGRFVGLNAIANQLRYPSSHTHYFSCVMLYLFSEAKDEGVKEQVTRVLLERLIVHRPHPWGLLITFLELIKNQRYQFWSQNFIRCATEIEKVFDSVSKSLIDKSSSSNTAIVGGGMSQ